MIEGLLTKWHVVRTQAGSCVFAVQIEGRTALENLAERGAWIDQLSLAAMVAEARSQCRTSSG